MGWTYDYFDNLPIHEQYLIYGFFKEEGESAKIREKQRKFHSKK